MKVFCYSQEGNLKGDYDFPSSLLVDVPNLGLIHLAVVRQNSNSRKNIAKVKTRAMVRGGGRKPFKQKGTGRARQGTIRAPQMRGGGVVFGPTGEENYYKSMPKKMRRNALFSSISLAVSDNRVSILDSFSLDVPSTKYFKSFLSKINASKKVLVVSPCKDFILEKSISNIPKVKFITVNYLNVSDLMNYSNIIFLKDSLEKAEDLFVG
jgi:large subunit ribosomal protein L4